MCHYLNAHFQGQRVNTDFILVLKGASFQGKETKILVMASATLIGNIVKIKKIVPLLSERHRGQ